MRDTDIGSCDPKIEIKNRIRGRVAIAGIGNIIRGDDGLGPKLIEMLRSRDVNASLFDCGTAPENYILPIVKSACDTLILVDAADISMTPGVIRILDVQDIANVTFSTHSPSPRLFLDLLKMASEDLNIFVISIQPKSTSLGAPLSEEVTNGLDALVLAISEALAA